ncbi:MAG: hypothetical protein CVT80_16140 [Alphaproteobacteria bacterium HGW-Alphaproteobacteria-2]|nr:MAG: hypothetical protein CVT80_16140 [Alphaproteobacteria bacterium HGW-Alphaproteobacteria-2]
MVRRPVAERDAGGGLPRRGGNGLRRRQPDRAADPRCGRARHVHLPGWREPDLPGDAVGSTGITAFARDGTLLGTVSNLGLGIEFLGLVSANADIAGVFLDLVGAEPAGFAIDNIRFGLRGQIIDPGGPSPIPLPAAGWMLLAGIGGLAAMRRRRRHG